MKSLTSIRHIASVVVLTFVACGIGFPSTSYAKDKKEKKQVRHKESKKPSSHRDKHGPAHDDRHEAYSTQSRSGFTLSLGTGYAGRGYYYGPPNSPYYYERPDVRYFATRDSVPREYDPQPNYRNADTEIAVQRALARAGYYDGVIDGQIGPASRSSIARFQQSRGLAPTGVITSNLLRALGLQ